MTQKGRGSDGTRGSDFGASPPSSSYLMGWPGHCPFRETYLPFRLWQREPPEAGMRQDYPIPTMLFKFAQPGLQVSPHIDYL